LIRRELDQQYAVDFWPLTGGVSRHPQTVYLVVWRRTDEPEVAWASFDAKLSRLDAGESLPTIDLDAATLLQPSR
jgi:hypothetical protein